MGAWRYVRLKAEELGVRLELAGRAGGAAPAAGSPTLHAQEQQELLDRAFAGYGVGGTLIHATEEVPP